MSARSDFNFNKSIEMANVEMQGVSSNVALLTWAFLCIK